MKDYIRRGLRASFDVDLVRPIDSFPGHLSALLRRHQIECVVDIGANVGEFGLLLRRLGYKGRIVSFEPVLRIFSVLADRAAGDPSWTVFNFALGEERGRTKINVSRDSHFSSLLAPNEYGRARFPGVELDREEQIRLERLDDVFPELVGSNSHAYLKIDTQGWDIHVLRGGEASLAHVLALQTELSLLPIYEGTSAYTDVIAYLNERGFDLTGLFTVSRDEQMRLTEVDCVMTRR